MSHHDLIARLEADRTLDVDELTELIAHFTPEDRELATSRAYKITRDRFGPVLYPWGTLELSSYGIRDYMYCGIVHEREDGQDYRLTRAEVLDRIAFGHSLGMRSFVLKAAEDPELTDDVLEELIFAVNKRFPDAALVLRLGERTRETYQRFFDAGADRYVLRHSAADPELYAQLHPRRSSMANRIRALENLKAVGFQAGTGMMIGAPGQRPEHLAKDLLFMADYNPAVVAMEPFVPTLTRHFRDYPEGSFSLALFMIALARIVLPDALITAQPSLISGHARGKELAVMAGANVLLPNLTPPSKLGAPTTPSGRSIADADVEAGMKKLADRLEAMGYRLEAERGDFVVHEPNAGRKKERGAR